MSDEPLHDDAAELQRRVAERLAEGRADGTYPPGLDDDLDAHWRRIAGRQADEPRERIARQLADLDRRFTFDIPVRRSSVPGGAAIDQLVARLVRRHVHDLIGQLDGYAGAVHAMFGSLVGLFEDMPTHVHADLVSHLEVLEGRFAEFQRSVNAARAVLADDAGPEAPQ